MDIQTVLIFILAILTVTIIVVSVYFIQILKELKETIKRTNLILNDFEGVTNALSHPLGIIGGIVKGVEAIKKLKEE